ncbi:hypothetical protein ACE2AJ_16005 [Aquihabitans daechungensis]|uniref:hypothetical protein n=1 Tax=Aquihabitans daechungensis TaxID=1052257 RepID=UPI003BA33458
MDVVIGGADQQHLLGDAVDLLDLAVAGEEVLVRRGLPVAEAGAGPGAGGAPLLTVDAVVLAQFLFDVEGLVAAFLVLVPDDVVRAADHAGRAAGAQPGGDDLVVQLLPLVRPPALFTGEEGLGGGGVTGGGIGHRHGRKPSGDLSVRPI